MEPLLLALKNVENQLSPPFKKDRAQASVAVQTVTRELTPSVAHLLEEKP
jgi:hypothetical protein